MRLEGIITKVDKYWAIEVPILNVITQGRTRKEAFEMIADAIEELVNKPDFKVYVYHGDGEKFEIGSTDKATLFALILKRQRLKNGLTILEVTRRLGKKSHNSYARYEQGKSIPTLEMFELLYNAVSPEDDLVLASKKSLERCKSWH